MCECSRNLFPVYACLMIFDYGPILHKSLLVNADTLFCSRHEDKGKYVQRDNAFHYQNGGSTTSVSNNNTAQEDIERKAEKDDKHRTYDWFKVNADELVAKVSKRIEDLEVLEKTAESTSSSVSH